MPDQPEIMAIGDSLAQGCRSMSVRKEFCEQSVAARIAQLQDWDFRSPDHPRPVIIDLEREIRDLLQDIVGLLPVLSGLGGRIRANAFEWIREIESGDPLSVQPYFDNLGITGAAICHCFDKTAGEWLSDIQRIAESGILNLPLQKMLTHFSELLELHMAINAYFLLNPSNEKCNFDKTPLSWVQERKPRSLIVQVGHNHGLFTVGSEAKGAPVTYPSLSGMDELINALAKLPNETEQVIVYLLPKLSAVANLKLVGELDSQGYAEQYEPVFFPSPSVLSGVEMAMHDHSVKETNDRIQARYRELFEKVGGASNLNRLKFVDFYGLLEQYDAKHRGPEAKIIKIEAPGRDPRIDNHYVKGRKIPNQGRNRNRGPFQYRLQAGGLQGVDGMHPTGVGYAMIACETLASLGMSVEEGTQKRILNEAYRQDRLLSNIPWSTLNTVLLTMEAIRNRGGSSGEMPDGRGLPGSEDASMEQIAILGGKLLGLK